MKDFEITAAIYKDIEEKIFGINQIADELNSKIKLNNYTEQLETLFVVFQCFPADIPRKVEEFKRMRRKTKTLELYLILDYQTLKHNSDKDNLQYIKQVFQQGCETFLKPIKGFDWNGFAEKIKMVLN